ncbi:MAG: hypothetical protein H6Q88_980, partial [Anaeromyxobacteraceae bacterium]|nr:hypothetical protein [Anaeromyxobacteraceae bacterium]
MAPAGGSHRSEQHVLGGWVFIRRMASRNPGLTARGSTHPAGSSS